jgi:flagellar biosynthetic protein FliR
VIDLSTIIRFALLLVRPGMIVMAAPGLGGTHVPTHVKIGLTVLLTAALAPSVPVPLASNDVSLTMLIARELVIGLSISLAVRAIIAAAELAGHLSGFQIGFSYAATVDPITGARNTVVTTLYGMLALLAFFAINGHHEVLRALAISYVELPIGAGGIDDSILIGVRQILALVFTVGARLAAPIIVVLLIVELAVGLIARTAPSLSFMVIGYPLRLIVGLAVLALMVATVPAVTNSVVGRALSIGLDLAAAFR